MSRRTERLTVDHLVDLPAAGGCVFWQLDPVRRREARGREAEVKAAWVSEVLREWGSCGRVVTIDGVVVGHALWAPPAYVPGAAGFPTAPVAEDAVVLTELHVDPGHRGGGLGRLLVQGMAKDLLRADVRAVETFAGVPGDGTCSVPVGFLLAVGFGTVRAHPTHPRLRMDLRTTLRLREVERGLGRNLGRARDRLLAPVRPLPQPVTLPVTLPTTLPRWRDPGV